MALHINEGDFSLESGILGISVINLIYYDSFKDVNFIRLPAKLT